MLNYDNLTQILILLTIINKIDNLANCKEDIAKVSHDPTSFSIFSNPFSNSSIVGIVPSNFSG